MATLTQEATRRDSGIDAVRRRLATALGSQNQNQAEACADRIRCHLPRPEQLAENVVVVPFGGGKDSSYVVAIARYAQLSLLERFGQTFLLRCVTNQQAGMAYGVAANIERVYDALGLVEDSTVELLFVEGNRIQPFRRHYRLPRALLEANRLDILMNGHLSRGSNRTTFCNACNFSMARSFVLGLQYGRPADLVITGDSPREQRKYAIVIQHMARSMNVGVAGKQQDFSTFLQTVSQVSEMYFAFVFGADAPESLDRRIGQSAIPSGVQFFSIFGE